MILIIVRLGGVEWDAKLEESEGREDDINQSVSKEYGRRTDSDMTALRSNIKRICKLGNEIEFRGRYAESSDVSDKNMIENSDVNAPSTDWHTWDRFFVDYYLPTVNSSESNLRVCQVLKWNAIQCQSTRAKYFALPSKKQLTRNATIKINDWVDSSDKAAVYPDPVLISHPDNVQISSKYRTKQSIFRHHAGGIEKRKQGEIVADFLLWMLSSIYHDEDKPVIESQTGIQLADNNDGVHSPSDSPQPENHHLFMERWIPLHHSLHRRSPDVQSVAATRDAMVAKIFSKRQGAASQVSNIYIDRNKSNESDANRVKKFGTNQCLNPSPIVDAAGGAGHVSLALAIRGVHSTVVDPRRTVGKLPGRDRKELKKSKLVPFSTYRAWFGLRPQGVDSFFREGNTYDNEYVQTTLANTGGNTIYDPAVFPICTMCSEDNLLPNCMAIVALHPDEATGSIVTLAVENKIPFVVVPCCVFSRLFPERIKPLVGVGHGSAAGNNAVVSTYYDLLDWIVAKHPAIKVTRLPFEGANIAVWASFKD